MMLLKDKHIFIVEDNAQNRVVFKMALVKHGATVDFERAGQDACFYLSNPPRLDLIILDLMLAQGLSGFHVYDEIRALPHLANVPIIAVSAMDPAAALLKTRAKGFNGFIPKPIDVCQFPQQIAAILGR